MAGRSDLPEDRDAESSFMDLIVATPLGDVLLFAAFCAVGAVLVRSFSVQAGSPSP